MSSPSSTLTDPIVPPFSTMPNIISVSSSMETSGEASRAFESSATPLPTPCFPKEVAIVLSTTVIIKDYPLYYSPTPIQSFVPTWRPLPDGSLIAPPYDSDMFNASMSLFVLGAVGAVFVKNILAATSYLRRGKVKKKILFYLLLASQLLAPFSLVPVITSHFWEVIDCTLVAILSYSGSTTSLGILITGILGLKAYRCLENSPLVPIVMGILQAATTAVVIADLVAARTFRRLTGSCVQVINLRYTRFFVGLQVVQALFITFCFGYASFRSRRNPAARGRISLRMSMEDTFEFPPFVGTETQQGSRSKARGWWDYVPRREGKQSRGQDMHRGFFASIFQRSQKPRQQPQSPYPVMHESKPSSINLIELEPAPKMADSPRPPGQPHPNPFHDSYGRRSPAPSSTSRFSRMFPRMVLFRQVLNDELLYTTFITAACLVVAMLVAISVNFETCLSITGWIAVNWAFISLLVVHSLGRVVHRHEREAWIQQSALRTTRSITQRHDGRPSGLSLATRNTRSARTSYSTVPWRPSISSRYRSLRERRNRTDTEERQLLDEGRFSWQFGTLNSDPFQEPSGSVKTPDIPTFMTLSARNRSHNSKEFEFEQMREQRGSWRSQETSTSLLSHRRFSQKIHEVPRTS